MTMQRHPNGGGWVEDTATVADSVYVGRNAQVQDHARVSGDVIIDDEAIVMGSSVLRGRVRVIGKATVGADLSQLHWPAPGARDEYWFLRDQCDRSPVLEGDVVVKGCANVSGKAHLQHGALVEQDAIVGGTVKMKDNAAVGGDWTIIGTAKLVNQVVFGAVQDGRPADCRVVDGHTHGAGHWARQRNIASRDPYRRRQMTAAEVETRAALEGSQEAQRGARSDAMRRLATTESARPQPRYEGLRDRLFGPRRRV